MVRTKLVSIDLADDIQPVQDLATFANPILDIFAIGSSNNPELDVQLMVTTSDGTVHGLNVRGIEMAHLPWPQSITGAPTESIIASGITPPDLRPHKNHFLISTDQGQLLRLDVDENIPSIPWQIGDLNEHYGPPLARPG